MTRARLHNVRRAQAVALAALLSLAAACSSNASSTDSSQSSTPPPATSQSSAAAPAESSSGSPATESSSAAPGKSARDLLPESIKSSGVLRFGTVNNQPPAESLDTSGNLVGSDVDIANALAEALGLKAEFQQTQFDGLIAGTLANRWDVIIATMNDTKARQAQVTFVDYFKSSTAVAGLAGNPHNIKSIEDFCGTTFAEQRGGVYPDMLQKFSDDCTKAGKKAITVQLYPDLPSTVQSLTTGRADFTMQAIESVGYQASQSGGKLEVVPGIELAPVHYGLGMRPADKELIAAVQGALNELIANGTYVKILTKWGFPQAAVKSAELNQDTVTE